MDNNNEKFYCDSMKKVLPLHRIIGGIVWIIAIAISLLVMWAYLPGMRSNWSTTVYAAYYWIFVLNLTTFLLFIESRHVAIRTIVAGQLLLVIATVNMFMVYEGEELMGLIVVLIGALLSIPHAFIARFISGLFHETWQVAAQKSLKITGVVCLSWLLIIAAPYLFSRFF